MTLSPWQKLVKPQRSSFTTALAAALLGWSAAIAWDAHQSDASLNAWGNSMATGLAATSVEPFMAQNHILLGVLANRISALPEVNGVAIYGLDNQNLALTSATDHETDIDQEYYFTAPVTVNDTIIGYVRISLQPPGWARGTGNNVLAGILSIVGIALLLRIIPSTGVLLTSLRRLSRLAAMPQPAPGPGPVSLHPEEAASAAPEPHFLLVARADNPPQLNSLTPPETLPPGEIQAQRVAALYGAECQVLGNRGFALIFSSDQDQDRAFQVVCAGFLLAGCLHNGADTTQYRLGCHSLSWILRDPLADTAPQIEDALLASACARSGQLAVTGTFFDQILRQERLLAETLDHPLGEDFNTADPRCHLITGLGQSYNNLIARQIAFLTHQSIDNANPSTF